MYHFKDKQIILNLINVKQRVLHLTGTAEMSRGEMSENRHISEIVHLLLFHANISFFFYSLTGKVDLYEKLQNKKPTLSDMYIVTLQLVA